MRKFWNLMLAALVIMGAAACMENDENVDAKPVKSLSFYAEIDNGNTRAYIEKDDDYDNNKTWNTIWEKDDELLVGTDDKSYTFTYDGEKFTCSEEGVTSLIGQTVTIYASHETCDSKAGKKGWSINGTEVKEFANNVTVKLEANTSFLRYIYNGDSDITFTVKVTDENIESIPLVFQDGELNFSDEVTISGVKGENFIPFWPQYATAIEATLSYSINGVKCNEATLSLVPGKVYNLGTLTDPEPEKLYLVPGAWDVDDAWFAAYFFNADGDNSPVTMTDENLDGIFECEVPAGMEKVIFCRMNPEYTEFGWNDDTTTDRIWNQTADLEIGVDPNNYYYMADFTVGFWGTSEGYDFSVSIIGLEGDWENDKDMTLEGDYYTLKDIAISATTTFKVRINHDWAINYGLDNSSLIDTNSKYTLTFEGTDIHISAGTYNFFFNFLTKEFYIESVGGDEPEELVPGTASKWAVVGDFDQTTNWVEKQMVTTATPDLFVIEDLVVPTDYFSFLIKEYGDTTWSVKYGGGITYFNPGYYMTVKNDGNDIILTKAGTYDFYFDLTNSYLYVVEADADYTTATEQTEDWGEPEGTEKFTVYVIAQPKSPASEWSTVNLYTWIDGGIGLIWPGEDITSNTAEINGYTYNYYTYPATYNDQEVNIIVNNGSTQTADIALGTLDKDYYVVYSANMSEVYTTAPAAGTIEEYVVATVVDPKPDTVSIYLKTTWTWSNWAVYAWGGDGSWDSFNTWPGKEKEYDQIIDGVTYKAWDVPASCVGQTGTQIIVTGKEYGQDKQSKNCPVTFTSGKDVFVEITGWDSTADKATLTVLECPY